MLMNRVLLIALAALMFGAGQASIAIAANGGRAGTLDPRFGDGGKLFAAAASAVRTSEFGAAALQGDGKLVVEIHREVVGKEGPVREIERRLPNGELDPSFGKGGAVPVGPGEGLALRPDGSILVGTAACGPKRGSLLLLDRAGARVTSFGSEGCGPSLGFTVDYMAVAPGGEILVAGAASLCPSCSKGGNIDTEPVVAKLLADGSPDPSFGKSGVIHVHADLGMAAEEVDGRSVVGLVPTAGGGAVIATGDRLVSLGPDGSPSPTFGKAGEVELGAFAKSLLGLPDGRLVVSAVKAAYSFERYGSVTVRRLLADGTPDPSFGGGGATELALPREATAGPLASAPGEGVYVAAEVGPGEGCRKSCTEVPYIARLGGDGRPDPGYGSGGLAALPATPTRGLLSAAELTSMVSTPGGGSLVLGGQGVKNAFAFATGPSGAPEPGFGEGGTLVDEYLGPSNLEPSGLALGPKGGFTVAAEGTSGDYGYGGVLMAFRPNGKQRPGSSGEGTSLTSARGEIAAAGGSGVISWWEQPQLVAVGDDGGPLSGWGQKGSLGLPSGFRPTGIDPGPGGGVTVVGSRGSAMAVLRLGPKGRPVPGFGDDGLAKVGFGRSRAIAFSATVSADGSVFLAGSAAGRTAAAKLLPNGRPDRGFGHRGKVTGLLGRGTEGTKITTMAGGVVVGSIEAGSPAVVAGVVRLDRSGRPVHDFRAIRPPATGRLLGVFAKGGRIVVVTDNEFAHHSKGGVELRAYRPDGSPAIGYGERGLATGGVDQPRFFHPVAAVQQHDGRIVVAGGAWNGEMSQVELMRFR